MRVLDRAFYVAFAAALTLVAARAFYGYMLVQTNGEWSAPLDDVFIHFDYARATAQGHPFEWCAGNGYSSGNTSLLYPFVLALGYWMGFTDQSLMVWAAIVACCSVFSVLLVTPRLFRDLPRVCKYLAPPVLLCVGALDWSLFSGMEVAFFLAVWAGALRAAMRRCEAGERPPPGSRTARWLADWELGLWAILVVTTRPEGATTIAVLGWMAAISTARRRGAMSGIGELVRAGLPPVLILFAQSVSNRLLTGEWSANGAIVKLTLFNPYMPAKDKLDEYRFLLEYVVRRNLEYHFSTVPLWGWVVPVLAAVPLISRKTRRDAIQLWLSVLSWLPVVALNGQVRWQNERYTMPAVAWLLLLAAMGLAVLVMPWARVVDGTLGGSHERWASRERGLRTTSNRLVRWRSRLTSRTLSLAQRPSSLASRMLGLAQWPSSLASRMLGLAQWMRNASVGHGLRIALASGIAIGFWTHQAPCMRDQIWFFGRASRNIRDQHVTAGRVLAKMTPKPNRIMLGDAGALAYASKLPGLDLIGLGGYHDLPFARASVHGLGATLELLERMPRKEWPEIMAIYPSWWGDLPGWFGTRLFEVPVRGNVICGGSEKVIYRTDWSALGKGAQPRGVGSGERIVDELDVADLISEREHEYVFPQPAAGFVDARVLADPARRNKPSTAIMDLFDAGRRIPAGRSERFRMRQAPDLASRLVVRTAVERRGTIEVRVDGRHAGNIELEPADGWQELTFKLPSTGRTDMNMELIVRQGPDWVDHHVWVVQEVR